MATFFRQLGKFWDKFREVDRRRLQQEFDIQRLFLVTRYKRLGDNADEQAAKEISEQSLSMPFEEQSFHVQENIKEQIGQFGAAMDAILLLDSPTKRDEDSKPPKEKTEKLSGLNFAFGGMANRTNHLSNNLGVVETRPLKMEDVSDALKQHIGFSLSLKRSQIDHEEAGQGVFLNGYAEPGTVVSLYPGIIYTPSQYRYMPGYPRMALKNSYLVSRFDGVVIDGKPWGVCRGGEGRQLWDGGYSSSLNSGKSDRSNMWQYMSGAQETLGAKKGVVLERRNPLALGHFINHPPKGFEPNVMLCSYDFPTTNASLRPYIPNVPFDDEESRMRRVGIVWVRDGKRSEESEDGEPLVNTTAGFIRTIVLVATKPICDEEIFLNYRLSNQKQRPSWYHPVDEEEDKRRWD